MKFINWSIEDINVEKKEIITERLLLRPIRPEDLEEYYQFSGDPDITMMIFLPHSSMDETREFLDKYSKEWDKERPVLMEYSVVYQGHVIGGVDLEYLESTGEYEIGWELNRDYRGKGFATEAARGLIRYAFEELGIRTIIAHCDTRNIASENVMKKLGMTLVDNTGTRTYPRTGVVAKECLYILKNT